MKTVALGSVATIDRQGVDPSSLDPTTPYLGLEHIERGGRIIGHDTVAGAALVSTKFRFSQKHVLYGKLRPNLGKVTRPDFDGVCSTDILPIHPGKDLDRDYLAHYLAQPSMVEFAASRTSGANLPRLSPTVLAEFQLPLPPLPEQRRIAAVLDQAETIRGKRREVLTRIETLAQSVLAELLAKDHFARVRLGDLIVEGPKNGLYRPASDYGSGTLIVRIDSFKFGSSAINMDCLKRVSASTEDLAEFAVRSGDLLVNRVNSREHVGKTALVGALDEPCVFESNMMRIRVDCDRLLPIYAAEYMQTEDVRRQVAPMRKDAVNQSSINQADVRSLRIPLPPLDLQADFVASVEAINRQRSDSQYALAADSELLASLQFRAFRGEL